MKRKFSILLAIVFTMAIFSGCGAKEGTQSSANANSTEDENVVKVIATTFAAYDWAKNVANGSEFVMPEGGNPIVGEEITVVGRFEEYDEDGMKYVHLVDATLE